MIETRRLKNVVIFVQTILSFALSRKIFYLHRYDKKLATFLFFFAENMKYWNKIISKPYPHNIENFKFTFNSLIYQSIFRWELNFEIFINRYILFEIFGINNFEIRTYLCQQIFSLKIYHLQRVFLSIFWLFWSFWFLVGKDLIEKARFSIQYFSYTNLKLKFNS